DRTLLDGQINVSTDHCRCTLIYMFSLHDALPISMATLLANVMALAAILAWLRHRRHPLWIGRRERHLYRPDWAIVRTLVTKGVRSEEHTSELQSRENLVCRLLLEKKKATRAGVSN